MGYSIQTPTGWSQQGGSPLPVPNPRPFRGSPTDPRNERQPNNGQPAPNQTTQGYFDLRGQALGAGQFGGYGEDRFRELGDEAARYRAGLQRLASGQDSLSAGQLRQSLQQNISGQQAMAASARPANATMAARTAAMSAGRMGSGLAGQQAMAGIAERQAAMQSLGNVLMTERGQDLQAAQGSRDQSIRGFGMASDVATGNSREATRKEEEERRGYLGLAGAGLAAGAMAFSDRRLKKDIADGGADADAFIKGLKAYRFKYKDAKYGAEGDHLGIMAQDLEATKLGRQAVVETGAGKAVHGARLATSLAAATARLGERLAKLEGGRK